MTILISHAYSNYKINSFKARGKLIKNKGYNSNFAPIKKVRRESLVYKLLTSRKKDVKTMPPLQQRKIEIFGVEHIIHLPEGHDIYEGLRKWYPDLYVAVLEEEFMEKNKEQIEEHYWNYVDYLEYVADF